MAAGRDRIPLTRLTVAVALGLSCDEGRVRAPLSPDPAGATELAFITQPSRADPARRIKPAVQVAVQDPFGNTVPDVSVMVTIRLGANYSGATLYGTTTATTVGGIATFSTLRIDRIGPAYTLVATASPHGAVTSVPFPVGPPVPP
ncbi:MAG: hypothetical protein ACREMV_06160 [Gemmatimonadales bacterium]